MTRQQNRGCQYRPHPTGADLHHGREHELVRSEIYIVVTGLGVGGALATLSLAVQNSVPFGLVGVATSALQFFRSVGGMLGLAVLGAVMVRSFSS